MRLVLDTNIVASGLLWDGTPARLIDAAQAGAIEIYTSRILLAELTRILKRAKFAKAVATSGVGLEGLVLGYAELALLVEPVPIPPTILADPDDDEVARDHRHLPVRYPRHELPRSRLAARALRCPCARQAAPRRVRP